MIKGYGFSFIGLIIIMIIFDYLQEAYLSLKVKYLPLSIALSLSTLIFSFIGYRNIRGHRFQKFIGFAQAIFLFITLTAAIYLIQLRSLSEYDRFLTIIIFLLLTGTLIISLKNIFYEGDKEIIPLDYMNEA